MLNEKPKDLSHSQDEDSKVKLTEIKPIQELKTIEFDDSDSTGFVCDVDTGICGPITQRKEEE